MTMNTDCRRPRLKLQSQIGDVRVEKKRIHTGKALSELLPHMNREWPVHANEQHIATESPERWGASHSPRSSGMVSEKRHILGRTVED